MNINEAIQFLDGQIPNPKVGLPEEIFLFVSRITPLVNVDLLIKDEKGRTLLSWRNNATDGIGWHVPGGIIRFKEKIETRIKMVAQNEIGTTVEFDPTPITINEVICKQNVRGHFISLLYKCFLTGKYVPQNKNLKWHGSCPKNLIKLHQKIYKKFI